MISRKVRSIAAHSCATNQSLRESKPQKKSTPFDQLLLSTQRKRENHFAVCVFE
jgi:hypothetical protein